MSDRGSDGRLILSGMGELAVDLVDGSFWERIAETHER